MNDLEDIDINLTPLIDVTLVVLIMFILVAPLLEQEAVSLAPAPPLSTQQARALEKQSPLVIHVHANQTITFNHTPVSVEELTSLLATARLQDPTVCPQLFQDENASFGCYQKVKNAVAKAGFETLDVILKPSE